MAASAPTERERGAPMVQLVFVAPPVVRDKVRELSERGGVTVSEVLRRAVLSGLPALDADELSFPKGDLVAERDVLDGTR